jgi:hippurate hydrolase
MTQANSTKLVGALAVLAAAEQKSTVGRVKAAIDQNYPALEKFYKTAHANPEVSLMEKESSKRFANELRAAGFDVTENIGGYGVVGILKNGEGKTVLVRTDMDALPIKEETNLDFASKVIMKDDTGETVPAMHACGHDMHMTCASGVARTLASMKDAWKGTLVVIGQPAEELLRGARNMINDGLFDKIPTPDYCLAQHVFPFLEAGKFGYVPGNAWANLDNFEVIIKGVGGHGAAPHTTKDPIVLASQIILALQTIASREIDPLENVVVTVGAIHGGTRPNVIPTEVTLQVTIRTYGDKIREQTLASFERIINACAHMAGMPQNAMPVIRKTDHTVATYNDPQLVSRMTGLLKRVVGEENVIQKDPSMGSEDFGLYGKHANVPSFMIWTGSGHPEKVPAHFKGDLTLPGLHSCYYKPELEGTLRTGILGMTLQALDLLDAKI